jgi:hypothetical protein
MTVEGDTFDAASCNADTTGNLDLDERIPNLRPELPELCVCVKAGDNDADCQTDESEDG